MKLLTAIMAAGYSRRFNGQKLVRNICGIPSILRVINSLHATGIEEISVVLRPDDLILRSLIPEGVSIIFNTEAVEGMASSLRIAARTAINSGQDLLIALADQPLVSADSFMRLIREWRNGKKGLISYSRDRVPVSPVIFTRRYLDQVSVLSGDIGGKKILLNNPEDVKLLEFSDPWEAEDMDNEEGARRIEEHLGCVGK